MLGGVLSVKMTLELKLEIEMLEALENQNWREYDKIILKYLGEKAKQLKSKLTTPYFNGINEPKQSDKYSTKARRTTDNGGIF